MKALLLALAVIFLNPLLPNRYVDSNGQWYMKHAGARWPIMEDFPKNPQTGMLVRVHGRDYVWASAIDYAGIEGKWILLAQ